MTGDGPLTSAQVRALTVLRDAGPYGLTAAEFGQRMWASPAWSQRPSQSFSRPANGYLAKLRKAGLADHMEAPRPAAMNRRHYITEEGRRVLTSVPVEAVDPGDR